ncbi:C39 family peptidase [Sorangium sp. So ce1504]|uniref:C39 family peptidase n=1 Tax=Sorangium sp. So ce1504 TaxID=3133337 RepID=UPI003F5F5F6B
MDQAIIEIDSGRPVVAAITPTGIPNQYSPAHVALIVGYDTTASVPSLIVNDPYPYQLGDLGPYGDPYIAHGAVMVRPAQYLIGYDAFTHGLAWTQTVTQISSVAPGPHTNPDTTTGAGSTTLPQYCCTPYGTLGPYPNPGDVHIGDPCYGTDIYGNVYTGRACESPDPPRSDAGFQCDLGDNHDRHDGIFMVVTTLGLALALGRGRYRQRAGRSSPRATSGSQASAALQAQSVSGAR